MKKYLGLFLLLVGSAYFTACDDGLLDPFTPGALDADTVIRNSGDLVTLLNTAYSYVTPTSEIGFNSTFTDEAAIGYANGGQGLTDNVGFILNPSSGDPNNIWESHYFALSIINRVIKFSDNVTAVDAADQEVINKVKAEALTLRAHCHIQLLTYFSTNPKDRGALGVQLSNDVYPTGYTAPRVSNGEIYDQIDADLAEATALYETVTGTVNPLYANKNFTAALKARVYALRGDYPNALTAAQNVIDNSGLTLATFANYNSVFHTDTNPANVEVIFKLKKTNGETRTGALWASVNSTVNGSPFYEIGRNLFNVLNTTDDASASTLTVTNIAPGGVLTIPGHTLQVNDMFVSTQSRPANATTSNGTSTSPSNSLLAGKVYFVKTVNGNNITLTDTAFGTVTINLNAAIPPTTNPPTPFVPFTVMANSGDIRYSTIVHPSSIINPNYLTTADFRNTDKLSFRKYPGTATNGLLVNDIKICRLTEMYMIKAEALISANDLTGAAAVIKQVRDARFNKPQALPVYANATEAWKDVLLERRKDFAAEGYRFIDLKRLGALANEQISRNPRDCEVNGACELPVTDYRFALPIPEVTTNPNQGIQQNPGY